MGKNRVTYGPRAFKQDATNAMKGDIVRGLIELITNADDAYGEAQHGKIRVEVRISLIPCSRSGVFVQSVSEVA